MTLSFFLSLNFHFLGFYSESMMNINDFVRLALFLLRSLFEEIHKGVENENRKKWHKILLGLKYSMVLINLVK